MRNHRHILTLFALVFAALVASAQGVVKWTAKCEMKTASTGDIILTAANEPGYHFYSFDGDEYNPLKIVVTEQDGVKITGQPTASVAPQSHFDNILKITQKYWGGTVSFTIPFEITDKKDHKIIVSASWQACNDDSCTAPETKRLQVKAEYAKEGLPADEPAAQQPADTAEHTAVDTAPAAQPDDTIPAEETTATEVETVETDAPTETATAPAASENLWWEPTGERAQSSQPESPWAIILFGFIGGLAALLTPCVWPLIPMTISFFLKKSGTRRDANGKKIKKKFVFSTDALIYGASIVVIYVVLGLLITMIFGAGKLNEMSTSAVFNIIFFAILVIFAISFFGAFDIKLPEKWSNAMDSRAEKTTGLLSIFFMAFTLVLVSFSCTGPIIGTLLVEAASQGEIAGPALGMLGFALGLAVPFSIFAMFPTLLQEMPKSGGWLNSVKVVLGFLELILALKFLSVADMAYGWRILDREVFLSLWIVLFAMLGFYLLGKITFPHDDKVEKTGVFRFILSIIPFAFAVYLIPGLWGAPLKVTSAFVPPSSTQDFNLHAPKHEYKEFDDYDEAMTYAADNNLPVLIDFSGYGCVNCRKMEVAIFDDDNVAEAIADNFVFVKLMVDDRTPLKEPITVDDNGKAKTLTTQGEKWTYLQTHKFGENSQPSYIMLDNAGYPLAEPTHYDESVDNFLKFLDKGLNAYSKTKNQ